MGLGKADKAPQRGYVVTGFDLPAMRRFRTRAGIARASCSSVSSGMSVMTHLLGRGADTALSPALSPSGADEANRLGIALVYTTEPSPFR